MPLTPFKLTFKVLQDATNSVQFSIRILGQSEEDDNSFPVNHNSISTPYWNRVIINFRSSPDERIFGTGGQYTELNLKVD